MTCTDEFLVFVPASSHSPRGKTMMAYDYIKRAYGLSFAPGDLVQHTVTGKSGEVRREDPSAGHYVMVRFDGQKHALPCHPAELARED